MASSSKQRAVVQSSARLKDHNAQKLILVVKTEYDLRTFRGLIIPVVLAAMLLRRSDQAKTPISLAKKSIVLAYAATFFVGFSLPLQPLVFQVLERVEAQPYRLSSNYW